MVFSSALVLLALPLVAPSAAQAKTVRTEASELEVVDLGLLRGGVTSRAVALNGSGQVAGDADTADGATHAFRWGPGPNGPMKDLGTLGGNDSHAVAINEAGDVAGNAQTSTGEWRAALWPARGKVVDLGTLGGAYSHATDLNDQGEIVGTAERADGARVAFRWSRAEGMQDLGTLGGATSSAQAINALGQVTGTALLPSGAPRAFLWAPSSGMKDLGTMGTVGSDGLAINSAGQVAGNAGSNFEEPSSSAFRWSPDSGMQILEAHTHYTSARAISDAGDVVGIGGGRLYGTDVPLRWTSTGLVELQQSCPLEIYPCGHGTTDVNADGFVSGYVAIWLGGYRSGSQATRWDPDGQALSLRSLGGESSQGLAINRMGQVAGTAQTGDGATHAVLWR